MSYKIKKSAAKMGISVRTLHYYDQIGLLKPSLLSSSGYRLYTEQDLEKLQKILFLKKIGFSLREIKVFLNSSIDKQRQLLEDKKRILIKKKRELEDAINSIEFHQTAELFEMPSILDIMRNGKIEINRIPLAFLTTVDSCFAATEIPFLYNSIDACNAAQEQLFPLYNEIYEKKFNQKILTYWIIPPLEVASSTRPIKKIEDWDNVMVQAISPLTSLVIENLGGHSISLPWDEGYNALKKKMVDATIQCTKMIVDYSLNEFAHYLTVCNLIISTNILTIDFDIWKSLSKDLQDIFLMKSKHMGQEKNYFFKHMTKESLKILSKIGMDVFVLDKKEREKWSDKLGPLREKLINDMGTFGQRVKEVAKKVNSEFPYCPNF